MLCFYCECVSQDMGLGCASVGVCVCFIHHIQTSNIQLLSFIVRHDQLRGITHVGSHCKLNIHFPGYTGPFVCELLVILGFIIFAL